MDNNHPTSGPVTAGDQRASPAARTPGPWCFEAENGRAHPRVYGADNSLIAEVGNANLMRWEVWDHDARLIAAAPELLEAAKLQEAADVANLTCEECEPEDSPETCWKCFELYDAARIMRRLAIAKATSVTPDRSVPTQSQEAR